MVGLRKCINALYIINLNGYINKEKNEEEIKEEYERWEAIKKCIKDKRLKNLLKQN